MTVLVYRDGKLVPKDTAEPRHASHSVNVLPDIQPFVTQDGTVIGGRADLRAYEEKHGVKQCGNDWTGPEKPAFWDERRPSHVKTGK